MVLLCTVIYIYMAAVVVVPIDGSLFVVRSGPCLFDSEIHEIMQKFIWMVLSYTIIYIYVYIYTQGRGGDGADRWFVVRCSLIVTR